MFEFHNDTAPRSSLVWQEDDRLGTEHRVDRIPTEVSDVLHILLNTCISGSWTDMSVIAPEFMYQSLSKYNSHSITDSNSSSKGLNYTSPFSLSWCILWSFFFRRLKFCAQNTQIHN